MKRPTSLHTRNQRRADQLRDNRAFVFATWIVQFLCFLNPKFLASSYLLYLYISVCVWPVRKPDCWFSHDATHLSFSVDISTADLLSPCNTGCQCDTQQFEPVCGSDSVMYFTPCHAGCSYDYIIDNPHNNKVF